MAARVKRRSRTAPKAAPAPAQAPAPTTAQGRTLLQKVDPVGRGAGFALTAIVAADAYTSSRASGRTRAASAGDAATKAAAPAVVLSMPFVGHTAAVVAQAERGAGRTRTAQVLAGVARGARVVARVAPLLTVGLATAAAVRGYREGGVRSAAYAAVDTVMMGVPSLVHRRIDTARAERLAAAGRQIATYRSAQHVESDGVTAAHARRAKSGKVVQVSAHQTPRRSS